MRYYDPSGYSGITKQCLNKGNSKSAEETKEFGRKMDTTSTSTRVVGETGQTSVYRVIRPEEKPTVSLVAKKPDRNMTTTGHVTSGSRNKGSQFISTTTNIDVANTWADKTGNRIVEIDLSKLPTQAKVYDLSTDLGRSTHIKGSTANRLAKASSEVLVEGTIPSNAINVIRE